MTEYDKRMREIEYSEFVNGITKPGSAILRELTPEDCNLIHLAMGVSGEAGELLDCIKKTTIYGKTFDLENAKEELGDLEFYLEALRLALGVTREEIIDGNVKKLLKRYPNGYSNSAAITRADKVPDNNGVSLEAVNSEVADSQGDGAAKRGESN